MIYNELRQHGTEDFPIALYLITEDHPRYIMAFHWHTQLEIIRILKGELLLSLDNRQRNLKVGDIAIANSETVHGATPKSCAYECIVFNLAFLKTGNDECDGFIESLLTHAAYIHEYPTAPTVLSLLLQVFDALREEQPGAPFKVIGLMQLLLGEIWRTGEFTAHLPPASAHDEQKNIRLKTVLRFIRENFDKELCLEDMAAVAGLSCKYFCKFFRDMTGTTPINYLMTYRIERAARKLLSTDKTVTQIAYENGFNDLSYFIKTFKAFKGTSPKDYRKR